jgi:pimeloyl-ACP methyl ester carboxylesterase
MKIIYLVLSLFLSCQAVMADIWFETFGDKKDPALLLVMGGLCQGVLWPEELCKGFAKEGFYVIRYDHRDAGYSPCYDFEKEPYDMTDMAKDAISVLDKLGIQKAHVFGLSMGGFIAGVLASRYPERVNTIALIATSCELRPMNLAFAGLPTEGCTHSPPRESYLHTLNEFLKTPAKTDEEKLKERIAVWNELNGSVYPLDETTQRKIHGQFLARLRHPESLVNHILAIRNSEEIVREAFKNISVPTLIFQGMEDPIFAPDHAEAMAEKIPGSRIIYVDGMGHVPNEHFYGLLIGEIKQLSESMGFNDEIDRPLL